MTRWFLTLCLVIPFFFGCENDMSSTMEETELEAIDEFLPMTELSMEDLSEFNTEGTNWSVMGAVWSNFDEEWHLTGEEGSGILVNRVSDTGKRDEAGEGAHLYTNFEHGDIELEIDFLVPKSSNSGIYFMSRYELQIRDTNEDEDLTSDDCGGIYAQWEDPSNPGETTGGQAPAVKASKAAGLWQNYRVLFRAPRFDASGNKTENARFEYVYHNGFLIHENVEVTSPTIEADSYDEVEFAPLKIQGDHGPVAFRNVKYKKYGDQKVTMENLTFALYQGEWDYIPDFEGLSSIKEGSVDNFDDLEDLAGQIDHFGIVFEGDLQIPTSGTYLFETIIDDGGDFYIDDQLVVHNLGEPGLGVERGTMDLDSGTHRIKITYFEEVWLALINLKVEGPEMAKHSVASKDQLALWREGGARNALMITADDEIELVRGFVSHGEDKLTHILSVGDPARIHYSYDVRNHQLVKAWKGGFADVTEMWVDRGAEQLLVPMNAALEIPLGTPVAIGRVSKSSWPNARQEDFQVEGYEIDSDGRPVFLFSLESADFREKYIPTDDGLTRRIEASSNGPVKNLWLKVAEGERIVLLPNGFYSIGNEHYVRMNDEDENEEVAIIKNGDTELLLFPLLSETSKETVTYEIVW